MGAQTGYCRDSEGRLVCPWAYMVRNIRILAGHTAAVGVGWFRRLRGGLTPVMVVASGLLWVGAGCASANAGRHTDAETAREGYWVTLPPTTGSNVPRRVWVDNSGTPAPRSGEEGMMSPKAFEQIQRQMGGRVPGRQ
jgi:hypothetical protein